MASEPKITEDIQRMLLPLISALSTFKNDVAFGEKHERPGLSNSTYGKPFAVFRVKERLFYADLLSAVGAFEALGLLPVADASVPVSDAAPRTSARTPPPRHTHAPVKEPVHTDDKASDAPTEDTPFAAPTPTPPPAPAPAPAPRPRIPMPAPAPAPQPRGAFSSSGSGLLGASRNPRPIPPVRK